MTEKQLQYKPDLETAQTAWDALWNHEIIDRPCTLVTAQNTRNAPEYSRIIAADSDFEKVLDECDAYLNSHTFLGEAMPAFRPGFGPDQMAAFLGTSLTISEDSDTTSWSKKIVTDWEAFLPLKIDTNNHYFQRMKEFHALSETRLKGRCLLCEIDMHSNVDLLEGLRGAEPLIFDMIDKPETVLRAVSQAGEIYRQVYEEFHQYGDKSDLGTTSWIPMYDRGKFNRIQADFIALLSPDLFRKFVLPAIEEEAGYLNRSCFHLDGADALRHLDDILAINDLDAIEWVPGAGNKRPIEWPELLHKIQKAGKIIILHLLPDELKRVHGEYSPERVVYRVETESVEEGLALLEWLKKKT